MNKNSVYIKDVSLQLLDTFKRFSGLSYRLRLLSRLSQLHLVLAAHHYYASMLQLTKRTKYI